MNDYIKRDHVINALNKLCGRVCQYSKAQRKVMCGACPLGNAFTVIEDDKMYKACMNLFGLSYSLMDEFNVHRYKILEVQDDG